MARPRKTPMKPEQAERHNRLEDAMRRADLTWVQFCARHGFTLETLWRWVNKGDPKRQPPHGRATSSLTLAEAFGIDPGYLRPDGPWLWAEDVLPFVPQISAEQLQSVREKEAQ